MRIAACLPLILCSTVALADDPVKPIPGIGPTGPMSVVHDGFKFLEGPAANAEGELYFVDVIGQKVLKAHPGGEAETVLKEGAGGLMFGPNGLLYMTQGQRNRVSSLDLGSGEVKVVAERYNDKPFNGPNDLVLDAVGGIYFTDPSLFGGGAQDKKAVYYIPASGPPVRLVDDLNFPNGLILTPDEKTLIVVQYSAPEVMAYPIEAPGKLGAGKVFCKLAGSPDGRKKGGADGVTIDTAGNFYATVPATRSVQIFDPQGKPLGQIPVPKVPTNCTFAGPDFKTLYITTGQTLYSYPMEIKGHRCGAGK